MPSSYFVGEPEKTVSGGVTTYKLPQDGAVQWTDSAGTELFSVTSSSDVVKLGGSQVTSTAAELNLVHGVTASYTFTPAAAGSTVCEVTVQAKDAAGVAMTRAVVFLLWLSDSSAGVGLTGTTASGAVAAKTASGSDFATLTSKKALMVQSKTDGTYVLSITDSAKTGFYVCAAPLRGGVPSVSAQLTSGNYGA